MTRGIISRVLSVGAMTTVSAAIGLLFVASVNAASPNITWDDVTDGHIQTADESGKIWNMRYPSHCEMKKISLLRHSLPEQVDACIVVSNESLSLALLDVGGYVLKLPSDQFYFRFTPTIGENIVVLRDGTLISLRDIDRQTFLSSLDDVLANVKKIEPSGLSPFYELDDSQADLFLDDDGYPIPWVDTIAISNNERYLAIEMLQAGIARIDLATRSVKLISKDLRTNNVLDYGLWARTELAISNDGQNIAVTGRNAAGHRIYTKLDSCGTMDFHGPAPRGCHFVDITTGVQSKLHPDSYVYNPAFSDDGQELTLHLWHSQQQTSQQLTVTPSSNAMRLDYLALGDSFSSGEGDIGLQANGKNYYLPGTDAGGEECHVSSRSYPFLLGVGWRINGDRVKSVACSGARLAFDYFDPQVTYLGQDDRLRYKSNIDTLQTEAIDQFIPGRVPQIEFVKKYRPRTVTFTAGGNDIGFANILRYCASSFFTCNYASETRVKDSLNSLIDMQSDNLTSFIEAIRAASPDTTIYVIGYPKFLSDTVGVCNLNSAFLDASEIRMINQGLERLNRAIKRAAADTSTYYIDVERSLQGGALCDILSMHFVTGYEDMSFNRNSSDMFHPNAAGHLRLAAAIHEQVKHPTVPDRPETPDIISYVTKLVFSVITQTTLTTKEPIDIRIPAGYLAPNITVQGGIYSEYTELAALQTDANGALDARVTLPANVHPGYHVLSIKGESIYGEEIDIQQFVTVTSSDPNDIDSDGIPDSEDKCSFIPYWYDDKGRNVCTPDKAGVLYQKSKDRVQNTNFSLGAQKDYHSLLSGARSYDGIRLPNTNTDNGKGIERRATHASIATTGSVYLWMVASGAVIGSAILITWLTVNRKRKNLRKSDERI